MKSDLFGGQFVTNNPRHAKLMGLKLTALNSYYYILIPLLAVLLMMMLLLFSLFEKRDEKVMQSAIRYEECIYEKYHQTPAYVYREIGYYPSCETNDTK